MFLTSIRLAKPKSKNIMVILQSTGSSHKLVSFRERLAPKKEIIFFDPLVDMECVYKETKKIRSMKWPIKISQPFNEHTYGKLMEELPEEKKKKKEK